MNSNGKRKRKLTRFSGAVLGVIAAIAAVLANVGFARAAIPVYAQPALHHVRTIHTNPFPGTSVRPNDAEGLAYVPQDGSIWLADDDSYQLLEIDVASGALKRVIPQSALAAAPRLGGTEVTEERRTPCFAYLGDSAPAGLDDCPAMYEAQVLVMELTFIAPSHRKDKIHKYGHIHLDDLVERRDRFKNELVIASHFSTRYHGKRIREVVERAIPDMLDGRLHLWL